MESAQHAMKEEEAAAIKQLIEQAKAARPQDEMILGGWLYNKTQKPLDLHAERIWSGHVYDKYPDVLDQSDSFILTEKFEKGIKSAVIYSRKTGEDPLNHYGYLVAWSDSYNEGKHTRKVYGYCGLLEKFCNIDWKKVEKELDASSSSFSYIDAYTRTSVKADIYANVVYAHFMS